MYVYLNWQYIFKAPPDAVMNMLQLISQEEVQEYFKKFFEYFKKPQASKTFLRNELPGHVQSNVSTISFLCNVLILIKKNVADWKVMIDNFQKCIIRSKSILLTMHTKNFWLWYVKFQYGVIYPLINCNLQCIKALFLTNVRIISIKDRFNWNRNLSWLSLIYALPISKQNLLITLSHFYLNLLI